jgi:hypothetical protein
VTNLRTPNVTARPATSVTANAAGISHSQASAPIPNPSAVRPAPISTKTARDGEGRRATPVAAARVGQPREQHG